MALLKRLQGPLHFLGHFNCFASFVILNFPLLGLGPAFQSCDQGCVQTLASEGMELGQSQSLNQAPSVTRWPWDQFVGAGALIRALYLVSCDAIV